jgi:hypothetical protein
MQEDQQSKESTHLERDVTMLRTRQHPWSDRTEEARRRGAYGMLGFPSSEESTHQERDLTILSERLLPLRKGKEEEHSQRLRGMQEDQQSKESPNKGRVGKGVYTRGAVTARDEKENRVIAPLSNTEIDQKENESSCVNDPAVKLTTNSTLSDKDRRGKELSKSAEIEKTSAAQSDVPSTRSVTAGKTTNSEGKAKNVLTEEKPEKEDKKQNRKIIEKKVMKKEPKTVKKLSKKDLKIIKDASYYEGADDSSDGEAKT